MVPFKVWSGFYRFWRFWQPLLGSDFKIEPPIVDVSAEEARQPVFLSQGSHGLVPVGFAFFHHGMEYSRTEGFGNHLGMTHRIGRVLVAGGSGCGIIDPFESGTGVDTEAARFLPCNTLVLPPAEHVWTIISCGRRPWQPTPEILDRNNVVLFQYIAISVGCVIMSLLIQRRSDMKRLFEYTVKLTVYADDGVEAYDIVEGAIDDMIKDSESFQNYELVDSVEIVED